MSRDPAYPVIAGTAALSAVGDTVQECFERLIAGDSGLGPLVAFPVERFGVRHAYQVSEGGRSQREQGLASRLLVRAVRDAATAAGLTSLQGVPVIVGTGLGETRTVESAWLDGKPLADADCSLVEGVRLGTDAQDVQVFSNACSASLYALAVGCDLIVDGSAETVVVAGVDVLSQSMFGLLDRVHLDPPTSVRPFDAGRLGVIMGDGAAAVVLRRHDAAGAGADQVAVRTVALGCDAFHATAPDDTGIEHTIRAALTTAGPDPLELDAVYAHGTGTVLNDRAEAAALSRTVPPSVPVTSVKGATGHTSGGSGLFSLCMAVETLRSGDFPGTVGLIEVDPAAAGLSLSPQPRVLVNPKRIQVDAFGFGGLNAVAILERGATSDVLAEAWARPEITPPSDVPPVGVLDGPHGRVAIRSVGLCFPDESIHDLASLIAPSRTACATFDLRAAIGRKGFRTMTPATRVAVVAAEQATRGQWAAGRRDDGGTFHEDSIRRGIVAASAHGNTATVCDVAELIDVEGVRSASALDLPNASRNVLASTVAIRLGVTGPCLTMDSGEAGGWDALRWAVHLISSGRCDEVLCLLAEAPSEQVSTLIGGELAHGSVALLVGRDGAAYSPNSLADPRPATSPVRVTGHTATLAPALGLATALARADARPTTLEGPTGSWQVRTP